VRSLWEHFQAVAYYLEHCTQVLMDRGHPLSLNSPYVRFLRDARQWWLNGFDSEQYHTDVDPTFSFESFGPHAPAGWRWTQQFSGVSMSYAQWQAFVEQQADMRHTLKGGHMTLHASLLLALRWKHSVVNVKVEGQLLDWLNQGCACAEMSNAKSETLHTAL
jgi:hypothetical protein